MDAGQSLLDTAASTQHNHASVWLYKEGDIMNLATQLTVISVALWAILVYWDPLFELLDRIVGTTHENVEQLAWRKEFVLHAAFLGTAAATVLGFTHDSSISKVIAVVWFVAGLWYSRNVANRIYEIEEQERHVHWQKLAGMIRSVVKSENEKVTRYKE